MTSCSFLCLEQIYTSNFLIRQMKSTPYIMTFANSMRAVTVNQKAKKNRMLLLMFLSRSRIQMRLHLKTKCQMPKLKAHKQTYSMLRYLSILIQHWEEHDKKHAMLNDNQCKWLILELKYWLKQIQILKSLVHSFPLRVFPSLMC